MGNKSFSIKKEKYGTSSLHYRLDVIDKEIWDESAIRTHQSNMITWFLETFQLPEAKKRSNNWNEDIPDISVFSPVQDDLSDWLKGNKPKKMLIDNKEYDAKTWRDVFLGFITWMENSKDYSVDYLFSNQERLFGKSDVIVEYSALKQLVTIDPNNEKKLSWYKSADGKFAKKLEEDNKDNFEEYVYHINDNASTLVGRIGSIMQEFNFEDDFVLLEVK